MAFKKLTGLSICFFLITGCVITPTSEEIKRFGDATDKAVSVITEPDSLQRELGLQTVVRANSCQYLKGQAYVLAAKSDAQILGLIVEQKKFAAALGKYAKALASVTDRGGITSLRAASQQFAKAATDVSQQAGAPPTVGPIANAGVNLLVNIAEIHRYQQIREIMIEVYPYLILAERKVEDDVAVVEEHLDGLVSEWERETRCVLSHTRSNGRGSYDLFVEFDKQKREIIARRAAIKGAAEAMRKVKEAHLRVIESHGDIDQITSELNRIVADATAIRDAFSGGGT